MISVLMSVLNGEETLERSLKSILVQTYDDFEFLIMDDGSNDGTIDILDHYKNADSRIKVFKNNENLGLTKSLNILATKASGEFFARQDCDDYSDKNRFKEQIKYLINENFDVCTTRAKEIDTRRIIPGYSFYIPNSIILKLKNPFIHGTLLIKKSVFNECGNYDENFYFAQDYKLFLEIIKKGFKVKSLREPLYYLNMKDNISSKFQSEQEYYFACAKKGITPIYNNFS
tara:strand:- start:948 stop:1637 length:690 start_codon:yes stop_codon:yes gene_type:complete